MKEAVLVYQYGMGNAGDFAINIGSLDLLNEFYDKIYVISKLTSNGDEFKKNKKYLYKYYNNIEIIEGPFNLNRSSTFKVLKNYLVGSLKYPYMLYKSKYKEMLQKVEMLFLNGGNLLRCESLTDYVRLYAFIFPLCLAKKNKVDFIMLPQSTTTINSFGIKLLKYYINHAKIVFAREKISSEKLKNYFPKSNIINTFDTAFFIKDRAVVKDNFSKKYSFLSKKNNNVCITLRKEEIGDIGELSTDKKNKISVAIERLINTLLNKGFTVTFVIQTKKDKGFTEDVYNKFAFYSEVSIIEEYDPLILREIYRNSICLFGMRLHSMILAMSVGTPVVGYFDHNWGYKNPGTLDQYNMPYTFIGEEKELFILYEKAQVFKAKMIIEIENSKEEFKSALKKEVEI